MNECSPRSMICRWNFSCASSTLPLNSAIPITLKEATQMLLTICRVSLSWRAVAFSLPELWGRLIDIAGFSDERLRDFLEYSRPSAIETFFDGEFGFRPKSSQLEAIRNRFSRVLFELDRVSYLVIRRFSLTKDHYELLSGYAPTLTLFSFEGDSVDPVLLPPQLFGKGAPLLQSLHLISALIAFEQVSYPSLRYLTVQDVREPFQPPTRTWLTFVSNHPRLETLKLSYAISVRFTDAFEWSPTVGLEDLREFTLVDDTTPCAYLLPKVKVSDTCRVSIRAGLDSHDGIRLLQDAFKTFISSRLDDTLHVTLTGTSVSFSNDMCYEPINHKSPYFFFKFQWQSSFEPFEELHYHQPLLAFLPNHYLPRVDALRISLPPVNGRCALGDVALFSAFREWLELLNSMKHLMLEISATEVILDLIGEYDGSDEDENGGEEDPRLPSIIFPSLEGITVVENNGEELDWSTFISFAEWRKGIRHKIKYVTVPKAEVDNLSWEDALRIAELDIEINPQ